MENCKLVKEHIVNAEKGWDFYSLKIVTRCGTFPITALKGRYADYRVLLGLAEEVEKK